MRSGAVESAVNDQVAAEFYSAYLYLSMAAYFEKKSLAGFAHWMRLQYQEEMMHAEKLFDFLLDNDARIELKAISQPPSEFASIRDVMEATLKHEKEVTASIVKLYELAVKENEYPTQIIMQWFISEQTEEEKNVGDIVNQLEMVGENGPALLLIDNQLANRTLQPAADPNV